MFMKAKRVSDSRRQMVRDASSLLRLFAVGIAWGTPLILVVQATAFVDLSAHPQLDRWLVWLVLASLPLMLFLAIAGIATVARLSAQAARLNPASVISFILIAGLPLLAWSILSALGPVLDFLFMTAYGPDEEPGMLPFIALVALPVTLATIGAAFAVVLGLAITLTTLWRRRWWLAPIWLAVWLLLCSLAWFGDGRPSAGSDYVGAGLLAGLLVAALNVVALFGTSLVATLIVAGVQRRRSSVMQLQSREA